MTRSLDDLTQAAGDLLDGGSPAQALELYEEAAALAQTAGQQRELSDLLGDMAVAYRRVGDVQAAIDTNRRAIEAARACGTDLNVARWSGNLGGLLYHQDDIDGAEACFREALTAAARTGSAEQTSIAAGHFAGVMGERGRFSDAVTLLAKARDHAKNAPDVLAIVRDQEMDLYLKWAYSLRQGNRLREARDVINRALANLVDAPPGKTAILLLILLGDIEENEGDIVAACDAIERATRASEATGDRDQAMQLRDLMRRMRG